MDKNSDQTKTKDTQKRNLKIAGSIPALKVNTVYFESNKESTPSLSLNLTSENILQGFIFSEVLGKPKALRRGR